MKSRGGGRDGTGKTKTKILGSKRRESTRGPEIVTAKKHGSEERYLLISLGEYSSNAVVIAELERECKFNADEPLARRCGSRAQPGMQGLNGRAGARVEETRPGGIAGGPVRAPTVRFPKGRDKRQVYVLAHCPRADIICPLFMCLYPNFID